MNDFEDDLRKARDPSTCPDCLSKLMRQYRAPARHFLLHSPGLEEEEYTEEEREQAIRIVTALAENQRLPERDYLQAVVLAPEALAKNPAAVAQIGVEQPGEDDPERTTWVDKLAEELAHRVLQKQVLFVCEESGTAPSKLSASRGRRELTPVWLCSWRSPAYRDYFLEGLFPSPRRPAELKKALARFKKKSSVSGQTFPRSEAHALIDAVFEGARGWAFARAVSEVLLDIERRFGVVIPTAWVDLMAAGKILPGGFQA